MESHGQCRLCLAEKKLCHSHIYPEFFYKPMYDEKYHSFFVLSNDPDKPNRFKRKGIREYLLCSDCEENFGLREQYARGIIYGGVEVYSVVKGSELHLKDIDYSKFKLFLLSLIWRMGIAGEDFFREVQLGPYEEALRLRLLNADPGTDDDFGCLIVGVKIDEAFGHWFLPPSKVKIDGRFCYRAVIGGLLFIFFVTNQKFPPETKRFFIKKDGIMILRADKLTDIHFLREECFEIVKAAQIRRAQN